MITRRKLFEIVAGTCLSAELVTADRIGLHAEGDVSESPNETYPITLATGEVVQVLGIRAVFSETKPTRGKDGNLNFWRTYRVTALIAHDAQGNPYWSEGGEDSDGAWERC